MRRVDVCPGRWDRAPPCGPAEAHPFHGPERIRTMSSCGQSSSGPARMDCAIEVRPAIGDATLQTESLLLHDRCGLSRPGAQLVLVAEPMTYLVIDRVLPVDGQRGAIVGYRIEGPVGIDDDVGTGPTRGVRDAVNGDVHSARGAQPLRRRWRGEPHREVRRGIGTDLRQTYVPAGDPAPRVAEGAVHLGGEIAHSHRYAGLDYDAIAEQRSGGTEGSPRGRVCPLWWGGRRGGRSGLRW